MAVDLNSSDGQAIRRLIPLATLPVPHFETLCRTVSVEQADVGAVLFRQGDADGDLLYLLSGEVSLQAQGLKIETIKAGSESARFALAHQIPRKIDGVARSPVRFLRLTKDTSSYLSSLVYEEDNSYMVIDEPEESSEDWMTTLLESPIFQRLPPANLQKILISLEEISVDKGEVVLRQGDMGDYYYLIKAGQCLVTRKPSENAKEIKLALLRASDTFGEDALLSEKPRNVTITALTPVTLLRLPKQDFITLIRQPSLKYVNFEQMRRQLAEGALLLDVRSSEAHSRSHLNDSINAPFFTLRIQLKTMNRARPVIVVCDDGKTSMAAAFLLLKNKFKASVLAGGMADIPPELKKTAASFSIDDGRETSIVAREEIPPPLISGQAPDDAGGRYPAAELEQLRKDNNELLENNSQLVRKCRQLESEKEAVEKQYRMLRKQTEKLTAVLDSLKKNTGG
ncbi:MAG: Crp/Fnr family transcriptional regulator [Gammaproteobacteria bacterium HGW-Gammaproteobacteria-3]|nr:MAG: Crp/Fnr family transcriptional regulator [Gammaproteobacteria bacterium HGW-Gammaproteobacteria-3]